MSGVVCIGMGATSGGGTGAEASDRQGQRGGVVDARGEWDLFIRGARAHHVAAAAAGKGQAQDVQDSCS